MQNIDLKKNVLKKKKKENNELNNASIKNRTFYYFDDIIKFEDFDSDNILLGQKSYENILVSDISYKILIDAKLLRITFDEIDGFIRVYDGTRYLVLLGSEKYNAIFNRIRYLTGVKSGITCVFSDNYARINVDLYNSLYLEKTDFS